MQSYSKVIDAISQTHSPVHLMAASHRSNKIMTRIFSHKDILDVQNSLKYLFIESEHNRHFVGTLVALDYKAKKFTFYSEEGDELIKGILDSQLSSSYVVPEKYEVNVKVITKTFEGNDEESSHIVSTKNVLLNVTPIVKK